MKRVLFQRGKLCMSTAVFSEYAHIPLPIFHFSHSTDQPNVVEQTVLFLLNNHPIVGLSRHQFSVQQHT